MNKINLRELFTLEEKFLPRWIYSENVIYLIRNLVNGKGYVGQAKTFYGRFVTNPKWLTHLNKYIECCIEGPSGYPVLYKAIRKYKSRNFSVEILEKDVEDLDVREMYWINELHTCIHDVDGHGYNMTRGGNDTSQMHTPKVISKKMETEKSNHEGKLAFHTDESYETNRRNHGGVLAINTPESIEKSLNTRREIYGNSMGACHTPEAIAKRNETQRANNGGIMPYNMPEVTARMVYTQRFKWINEILGNLEKFGLEANYENFYKPEGPNSKWSYRGSIKACLKYINHLRSDARWTEVMEDIFSHYSLDDNGNLVITP